MHAQSPSLEELARRAVDGDAAALRIVCTALESPLYRLSVRILADPSAAEDATQEVLIKVVTHLASFEGRSALTTWAHRIAVRHLLEMKKSRAEERALDEETIAALLEQGMAFGAQAPAPTAEDQALVHEIRLSCTQGMLLVLGRDERLALVLVDLLGFDGAEAASIAEVAHDAFRQRLARARLKLGDFLRARCGVVEKKAACRCDGQVAAKKSLGHTKLRYLPLAREDLPLPAATATASAELRAARAVVVAFHQGGLLEAPESLRARLELALPTLLESPRAPA